jgi:hypothetical protein
VNYTDVSDKEESSPESGSDFDDDEDPDKIEVPGMSCAKFMFKQLIQRSWG